MDAKTARECIVAFDRAKSLRIRDLRYRFEGNTVVLEGAALTPDAIDSAVGLFTATSAREVRSLLRHEPPDPANPGMLHAGHGYVDIVAMGPNACRLVETITWEVKAGDTLPGIALAVYGDAGRTQAIVNANRNQIAADGNVREGQRLRIPPP